MKRTITLIFEPEGRSVRIALGTTIFQAASEVGVGMHATSIPHKDLDRFPSIKEYLRKFGNIV